MGTLFLVRHGQANSGATSEAEYDRLSERGHLQARHLGDWLRAHEQPFDHVISGDMRRHRETAAGMGVSPAKYDPRLNEMDYFALARDQEVMHDVAKPVTPDDWTQHIPHTLTAWHDTAINGAEPFAQFEARIGAALADAAKPGTRVLAVTSGGVIASVMRQTLGLGPAQMGHILLPIYNASLHQFHIRAEGIFLAGFNAVPHLAAPEHAELRTHL